MNYTHDQLGCEYYRELVAVYRITTTGDTTGPVDYDDDLNDESFHLPRGSEFKVYRCGYCGKQWKE